MADPLRKGLTVEAVPRNSLVDVLEQRLSDDILAGRHPTGAYLPPERELAAGYGVTRTSLKHAFGRLIRAGLLETRHGVGTRVRDFTRLGSADLLPMLVRRGPGWVDEVFEARRSIGVLIAEAAAVRSTQQQHAELRALLRAVRDAEPGDAVQLADAEVHRALARASGNRVYGLLTNTLLNAYLVVRGELVDAFLDGQVAHDRLEPVVAAVERGAPGAARQAADEYLSITERIMMNAIGTQ